MATASINPRVTKVVEVSPASVTLTLSPVEAAALLSVTGHLTGRGVRDITNNIWEALRHCFKDYCTPTPFESENGNAHCLSHSGEAIVEWANEHFVG
jgi:hypothetical protein